MRPIIFSILSFWAGIAAAQPVSNQTNIKGLKDYYQDYFPIGVSVGPYNFNGSDSLIIINEFASITAENIMKMGPIHPEPDEYNWQYSDQMMAFAKRHGLKVRGHTLCWHNQTGRWLFEDAEGQEVSKEVLLNRLKEHIFSVAGRYKDQVYAWDVVNEVISDNQDEFLRQSKWYQICGEEFIYKAFEYAHDAAPNAILFYNDYSATNPVKRDKIVRLIKGMQERGIPIHGMGMQGHWSISHPSEKEIRDAIQAYADLGLQVQITELDISVYAPNDREKKPDASYEFTPEQEQKQIDQYRMIFNVFRDFKNVISGVTFWNVSDRHSWLDNFPVRGRKNYPLLFDEEGKRKKAYSAVTGF
ncbi:MAG: endo-1,4-beta-xylanase [Saprospiraceae bacterium]